MGAETCAFGSVGYVPFVPTQATWGSSTIFTCDGIVRNNKMVMDHDARLLIPGKTNLSIPMLSFAHASFFGGRAACIVDLDLPWLETLSRRAHHRRERKSKLVGLAPICHDARRKYVEIRC